MVITQYLLLVGCFAYSARCQFTTEAEYLQPNPYNFGYTIQDADGNTQHRAEEGNEDGVKKADKDGFRVNLKSNEPGLTDAELSKSDQLLKRVDDGASTPANRLVHTGRAVALRFPQGAPKHDGEQREPTMVTAASRTDYSMSVNDFPIRPSYENEVAAYRLRATTADILDHDSSNQESTSSHRPEYDKPNDRYLVSTSDVNPFTRGNVLHRAVGAVHYAPKKHRKSNFKQPNPFEVLHTNDDENDLGVDTTTPEVWTQKPPRSRKYKRPSTTSTTTTSTTTSTTPAPARSRVHMSWRAPKPEQYSRVNYKTEAESNEFEDDNRHSDKINLDIEEEPVTAQPYRHDLPYGARLSSYKKLTSGFLAMASERLGIRTALPLVTTDSTTMASLKNMTKEQRMKSIISLKTPTLPFSTNRTSREKVSDGKFIMSRYGESVPLPAVRSPSVTRKPGVRTHWSPGSMTPAVQYSDDASSDSELTTAANMDLQRAKTRNKFAFDEEASENSRSTAKPQRKNTARPKHTSTLSPLDEIFAKIEEEHESSSTEDPKPTRPRRPRDSDIAILPGPASGAFSLIEPPTNVNGMAWPYRYNVIG